MKRVMKLIVCILIFNLLFSCSDNENEFTFFNEISSDMDNKTNADEQNIAEKINPITPDEDVLEFFRKNLPEPALPKSDLFFVEDNEIKCVIINSMDEFSSIVYGNLEEWADTNNGPLEIDLPEIDFNSYTLIIGQHRVPCSYHIVLEQYILEDSQKTELNLIINRPINAWTAFSMMYYWGLYPKFVKKLINVNIVISNK
jgi:hypothetical protein